MIWDAIASENNRPFHLQVRGEFKYVKAKPLGDGFTGLPVRAIRGGAQVIQRESDVRWSQLPAGERLHGSDD